MRNAIFDMLNDINENPVEKKIKNVNTTKAEIDSELVIAKAAAIINVNNVITIPIGARIL